MLQFGIYHTSQLEENAFRHHLKKGRRVSVSLYPHASTLPHADEIAEAILLLFSDDRGAYKRTYQNRFEAFDKEVLSQVNILFTSTDQLLIQDVAVSDGRTALDFFTKLSSQFPALQYTASDYNPTVLLLQQGKLQVTLSHQGKVLEIVYPPFVFNKIKNDSLRRYPLNLLLRMFIDLWFVRPLLRQYRQNQIQAKELMLFAPKVLKMASENPHFQLKQHNILKPFEAPSHIVRAMNILNPSYFTEPEFRTVLHNIHGGLKDQGILITGSNQDAGSVVHGGVYQKTPQGFERILKSGNGSPIESLLLTCQS